MQIKIHPEQLITGKMNPKAIVKRKIQPQELQRHYQN